MTLTFDSIKAAAERLKGHIERTPMRRSRTLSEITGAEVWVKFENLQFTAAYKERGALNVLSQLNENARRRGVIAASLQPRSTRRRERSSPSSERASVLAWRNRISRRISSLAPCS